MLHRSSARPAKDLFRVGRRPTRQHFVAELDRNVVGVSTELASAGAKRVAAILTATAVCRWRADRLAPLPDIAASAGVSRTTLHRTFADRETLV